MNELALWLGVESWKPVIGTLLLPPVPFIVLVLVGARLLLRRRLLGWLLVLTACAGLWLSSTPAAGTALERWLVQSPRALQPAELAELRRAPTTAIVVLGGGRRHLAPEYGVSTLAPRSAERLRYGLWLARETGLPVAFSGGVGHGAEPGASEAEIAARIAEREFRQPLRWTEGESRDTRENAVRTVALLQPQGIVRIVLVTDAYHMRRTLHNFERAAAGNGMSFVVAPLDVPSDSRLRAVDFLPQHRAMEKTRLVLHEWIGWLAGA